MSRSAAAAAPQVSVTILVIAYRMATTIKEAIASALSQTYPSEIIISDDCSEDGSFEIANEFVADYAGPHSVRVRRTAQNLGLCAHLNELAREATGDVFVFLAGDDVAYPSRVQKLVDAFVDADVKLAGSAVDEIDKDGRILATNVRALPVCVDQRWFLTRGKMTTVLGASMAVRRELLVELPPLSGAIEDNMLTLRAVFLGRCACLQEPLLGYRRHDGNFAKQVFVRKHRDYATFERRNRRVIQLYRDIAADQENCASARRDLDPVRLGYAHAISEMYRLEADMREAILDKPRLRWMPLLWRGLRHPGLRRRSLERLLKLIAPRRLRLNR